MTMRELWERIFVIRKCAGCGEILSYEQRQQAFCDRCRLQWQVAKTENCSLCFQAVTECGCMPKGLSNSGALTLRKLVFYRAARRGQPQNQVIYWLKKHPTVRIHRFLAGELAAAVRQDCRTLGIADPEAHCVLTFVPRGRAAKNRYGLDQAELLSQALSEQTAVPFVRALRRRWGGKEQKRLDRDKRFRNTQALFAVASAQSVQGKHVFLVDDVVTTGASMAACVKLLQQAGAVSVSCLCIGQD